MKPFKTIALIALAFSFTQTAMANHLDVVVCGVHRGMSFEKVMYFNKTEDTSALHLIEYERAGKRYVLTAREKNSEGFRGLTKVRLDIWDSKTHPDTHNVDNLRFEGRIPYTDDYVVTTLSFQNPAQNLSIVCDEYSSVGLQSKFPGVELILVP